MALFIRQDEERSELQKRLATELQEKARKSAEENNHQVDGVEDSSYIENLKKSAKPSVIITLLVAGILLIIWLTILNPSR